MSTVAIYNNALRQKNKKVVAATFNFFFWKLWNSREFPGNSRGASLKKEKNVVAPKSGKKRCSGSIGNIYFFP